MEKHYLFKSGNPFDRIAFEDTLGFLGVKDVTYFFFFFWEYVAD